MSKGVDRAMAYRTMRAVERANPRPAETATKPTRWQRWQAWLDRVGDRLLG